MANTCTNRLYLSTRDKHLRDDLAESIRQSFDCNDVQQSGHGEVFDCEMEFDSRWTLYVGFNIYANGEWRDKFADKY